MLLRREYANKRSEDLRTIDSLKAKLVRLEDRESENDNEMKEFIKRMVKSKRPGLLIQEKMYDKLTEEYSGKGGGKSWRYLIKVIDSPTKINKSFKFWF